MWYGALLCCPLHLAVGRAVSPCHTRVPQRVPHRAAAAGRSPRHGRELVSHCFPLPLLPVVEAGSHHEGGILVSAVTPDSAPS